MRSRLRSRVLIHGPTFLREYERFWHHPKETPIVWVGLLFAIMCLVTCYQQHPIVAHSDNKHLIPAYKEKSIQCLVLGKYTNGPANTIETLLLNFQIESFRDSNNETENSLFLALVIRLAQRMGYHKDPSHLKTISTFQAEMQRRAWALITHYDAISSSQTGLPRVIRESHTDTAAPLNLLDEDLYAEMAVLPAPRPDTTTTPIQYLVSKNRILSIYNMISDLKTSINPQSYQETMRLDTLLDTAYTSLPQTLQDRPMANYLMNSPFLILNRIDLSLLTHRAKCTLHYTHAFPSSPTQNPSSKTSRTACINSALQIIYYQTLLEQENEPGGRLYQQAWKLAPIETLGLPLATTILCRFMADPSFVDPTESETRQRALEALETSCRISLSKQNQNYNRSSSRQALQANEVIRIVLAKAGNELLDLTPRGNTTMENEISPSSASSTSMDVDRSDISSPSTVAEGMPLWTHGVPKREQLARTKTNAHPTNAHWLLRHTDSDDIDFSDI
ncbi:hypothetical protein G7Y89_g11171 [Cudoniella acicularis]|uniref:Xylanolytic transcriptional activator regulatory domain-containing protein n=1 Tax=Cudoniella acicularis TaxID=354080 RepID=A0A8H4W0W4_9HELO|nr:hypothetical protein G7Y89_g11171 [Cudoniella acicularis]